MPALSFGEIALRLLVAVVLGGLVGLDRELRGKPAGLRTHALVALGAALIVVASAEVSPGDRRGEAISRVAQGVLTGIGFLGAGVILRDPEENHVHGLTTAAAIWVTALIGVASGAGAFREVGLAVVLTVAVLFFGVRVERLARRIFPQSRANGG
jgi:putative Mg2+ transporter-C (MgtC) family protein